MISQPEDDAYGANNITKGMTTLCCSAGVEYLYALDSVYVVLNLLLTIHSISFETVLPAFTAFPQFLRDNGYKNPTNPDHLAWHEGHKTDLNAFPWLLNHPRQMEVFMQVSITDLALDSRPCFARLQLQQEALEFVAIKVLTKASFRPWRH